MRYEWKTAEEVGWAMASGGLMFIFELLSEFDLEAVTSDPETWIRIAIAGLVRATFVAGLLVWQRLRGGGA